VVGVDQVSEVDGAVARVVAGGDVTVERRLDDAVHEAIGELASACARAIDDEGGPAGPSAGVTDPMETTVLIEQEGEEHTIRFSSGDDVPPAVTQLVSAVLEAPYRDPGSRWRRSS
jgi:hypothetical protein